MICMEFYVVFIHVVFHFEDMLLFLFFFNVLIIFLIRLQYYCIVVL